MNHETAFGIVSAFGDHLVKRMPIIKDEDLLPYGKTTILHALLITDNILCCVGNTGSNATSWSGMHFNHNPQLDRHAYHCLAQYSRIDWRDRRAVRRFNSYPTIDAIPEPDRRTCMMLAMKYSVRDMLPAGFLPEQTTPSELAVSQEDKVQ